MAPYGNILGRTRWRWIVVLLACFLAAVAQAQAPAKSRLKRVLVLDKSQGGKNGHLESRRDFNQALAELAVEKGFEIVTLGQSSTISQTSAEFSPNNLAGFQVVIFSNNDGVDAQLDSIAKRNFEAYVKAGGGFIAIHAASAFINNWPFMNEVLVQLFFGPTGGWGNSASLIRDPETLAEGSETKGIFASLAAPSRYTDEFYGFRESPRGEPGLTVLLRVDENSASKPLNYLMGEDHPIAWAKEVGKGRVVSNSLGHSWSFSNSYTQSDGFLKKFLYGTLRYAAGDFIGCMDADDKNYNPDATKNDATQCQGPAVNIRQGNSVVVGNWASFKQGAIHVNIVNPGAYRIQVMDVAGRIAYQTATR
jgi:type 1 glutamine amidotransferase